MNSSFPSMLALVSLGRYNGCMTYRYDGTNWIVRLNKGERLMDGLRQLIAQEKLASAWLQGLGGAAWAELGFYDLPNQTYHWQKIDEPLEITSLQGNIAFDGAGEPVFHVHGSFSRADMTAVGGHVKDLEVAGTCEILVRPWNGDKLTRKPDDQIGLSLLDL